MLMLIGWEQSIYCCCRLKFCSFEKKREINLRWKKQLKTKMRKLFNAFFVKLLVKTVTSLRTAVVLLVDRVIRIMKMIIFTIWKMVSWFGQIHCHHFVIEKVFMMFWRTFWSIMIFFAAGWTKRQSFFNGSLCIVVFDEDAGWRVLEIKQKQHNQFFHHHC